MKTFALLIIVYFIAICSYAQCPEAGEIPSRKYFNFLGRKFYTETHKKHKKNKDKWRDKKEEEIECRERLEEDSLIRSIIRWQNKTFVAPSSSENIDIALNRRRLNEPYQRLKNAIDSGDCVVLFKDYKTTLSDNKKELETYVQKLLFEIDKYKKEAEKLGNQAMKIKIFIGVYGFASNDNYEGNQELSDSRAKSIRNYIEEKLNKRLIIPNCCIGVEFTEQGMVSKKKEDKEQKAVIRVKVFKEW